MQNRRFTGHKTHFYEDTKQQPNKDKIHLHENERELTKQHLKCQKCSVRRLVHFKYNFKKMSLMSSTVLSHES